MREHTIKAIIILTAKRRSNPEKINSSLKQEAAYETTINNPHQINWICPVCNEEVLYVKEGIDGTISHFRHKSKSKHQRISEGKRHNKAKKLLKEKFEKETRWKNYDTVKLEEVIEDQIADIYIESEGKKIAVEIQCSPEGKSRIKRRTEKYNEKGIHVLWILDFDNFMPEKKTRYMEGYLFRESIKWLQKQYYGRVYGFTIDREKVLGEVFTKDELNLGPRRLESKSRFVSNDWWSGEKYYKTVAKYTEGDIPGLDISTDTVDGTKIAKFYDETWWDTRE